MSIYLYFYLYFRSFIREFRGSCTFGYFGGTLLLRRWCMNNGFQRPYNGMNQFRIVNIQNIMLFRAFVGEALFCGVQQPVKARQNFNIYRIVANQ